MCKTHRSYKKNKKDSQVRHYESKTLKYQCVCFVLVIYYWTWGPALRVVCIHSETPLEKTDLSFTRGYQLGDSFCVRDTGLFPLPLPALRPQTCASLCRVPVSVSSYVCQFLWCLEDLASLVFTASSGSYNVSAPSSTGFSGPHMKGGNS